MFKHNDPVLLPNGETSRFICYKRTPDRKLSRELYTEAGEFAESELKPQSEAHERLRDPKGLEPANNWTFSDEDKEKMSIGRAIEELIENKIEGMEPRNHVVHFDDYEDLLE